MTEPEIVTVKVDLLLTDGFVLTEYAGVVDLLRLANRIALKPFFSWRSLSARGGAVASPSDAVVQTTPFEASWG